MRPLTTAALLLILILASSYADEQQGIMVFPRQCMEEGRDVRVEAPMKDGEPNMKEAKVLGKFIVNMKCSAAAIVIRRKASR